MANSEINTQVTAFSTDYLNNILQLRGYPVDRLLQDSLTLPYRLDEIKIKPNEFATAGTFNVSMERLYDNFLYLVSNTKLSSPQDVRFPYRIVEGHPKLTDIDGTSKTFPNMLIPGATDKIVGTTFDRIYSVSITETELRLWSSYDDKSYSSKYADDNKSKIFGRLISLAKDNTDNIYVLDETTLYRYSINGVLNNDPVLLSRMTTTGRRLLKYIGGGASVDVSGSGDEATPGAADSIETLEDKHRYVNPQQVVCDGNNVYVVDNDDGKYVVKKYDARLNWLDTYTLLNITEFKDIVIHDNKFFILDGNNINHYDNEFVYTGTSVLHSTDPALFLQFSQINPNVVYVIRSKYIEKIYYTRLEDTIRKYDIYRISPDLDVPIVETGETITNRGDVIILPDVTDDIITINTHNIQYFWSENENNLRKEILYEDFDNQIYTLNEVKIEEEEFINSFVYNKSIGKMLYNLQLFLDNVKGSFAMKQDNVEEYADGSSAIVPKFIGVTYIVENPLFMNGYEPTIDNFVHINEPFITSVFNRCLNELYLFQLELLDIISIQYLYDSNILDLEQIIPRVDTCKLGIMTDESNTIKTDDERCIIIDKDSGTAVCENAIINEDGEIIVDENGDCIIHI